VKKNGFQTFEKISVSCCNYDLFGMVNQVYAQEKYPTRAVDIYVAFAPGGGTDSSCRLMAEFLKKKWDVPVNVVNKPGGESIPANLEVYAAKPDGYTVLADQEVCSSLLEISIGDLPLKVMDRTFISVACMAPFAFFVPSNSRFMTLKDAIEGAKKDPGNFTWAKGALGHEWVFRQFFKAAGVDISKTKPVVAKGGTPSVALVAGGHVGIGATPIVTSRGLARADKIRYLAVARERNPEFPNVSTTAELGYRDINVSTWVGFSGPPNLPANIVNTWEKTLREMVSSAEFLTALAKIGFSPSYLDSKGMKEHVNREMKELAELFGVERKIR
jgi:tripartite-type tricarboxylate transporter receptor subunit TctC